MEKSVHIRLIFLCFNHIWLFTCMSVYFLFLFLLPPTFFFFLPSLHSFFFPPFVNSLLFPFFLLCFFRFSSLSYFFNLSFPSPLPLPPSSSSSSSLLPPISSILSFFLSVVVSFDDSICFTSLPHTVTWYFFKYKCWLLNQMVNAFPCFGFL